MRWMFGNHPARLDLRTVDAEDFNIRVIGDRILITPSERKHRWSQDELELRSLVIDRDGFVLSSGFPKFFNYGENTTSDVLFEEAVLAGRVVYTDKLDGSLIIVDVEGPGQVRFRTRGQVVLGDFEERVMRVVDAKYPGLRRIADGAEFASYSFLLEYIGPQNQIVVRYDEEDLVLLGAVEKTRLRPIHVGTAFGADLECLKAFCLATGVRAAHTYELPAALEDAVATVRGWSAESEGVVACHLSFGWSHMVKVKSEAYVRLHSLKFRLNGNVGKLLFLLDATTEDEARDALFDLGIDHEAQAFVAPQIAQYVARRRDVLQHHARIVTELDTTGTRKDVVLRLRQAIADAGLSESYFHAALKTFDGRATEALDLLLATLVLEVPVGVVRQWRTDGQQAAIGDLLRIPVTEGA